MVRTMTIKSPKMPSHTESAVRRTSRKSLPNSELMFRRQMIRENFLKTPESKKKIRKLQCQSKNKHVHVKAVEKLELKTEEDAVDYAEEEKDPDLNDHDNSSIMDKVKQEPIDEELSLPPNFVVTKATGIKSPINGDIHPTYFPSEEENSGVIIFKSNSRRAILNISFAKCFVILNGTFSIDDQGQLNHGDFFKAPAGSKLGIKYLGGSDDYGKIIFFKSVN